MGERATLVGGSFAAEPCGDGWRVTATLPARDKPSEMDGGDHADVGTGPPEAVVGTKPRGMDGGAAGAGPYGLRPAVSAAGVDESHPVVGKVNG
ncbi:hypothetical protein [Sphaerisporangium perillae]|uniref:hypothetical protein n=1 Tax=Sphaerisporangium perillae TaxID=2935860 RepID=UPI00200EC7F7|nr:hypothetical protein [Sphaerisporangium perillae]